MKDTLVPEAKLVIVKVDDIIEYENNNKEHWDKQIKAIQDSIDRFTYIDEMVLSKNNVVILGHWRLEAIKQMWYDTVEVKQLDIYINDEKALRVIHNVLATYDVEFLLENLQLDKQSWVDFSLWGVDFWGIESVDCTLEDINNTNEDPYDFWVKEIKGILVPIYQKNYIEVIGLLQKANQQWINIWNLFIKILENVQTTDTRDKES